MTTAKVIAIIFIYRLFEKIIHEILVELWEFIKDELKEGDS